MARTDGDPEAWARAAWAKAKAAKDLMTDPADEKMADAFVHLAHAVELLATRMKDMQGYND